MTAFPEIAFFLSRDFPVRPPDALWKKPMPVDRQAFSGSGRKTEDLVLTYGQFFAAVRAFLEQDAFAMLINGLSRKAGQPVSSKEIRTIGICLEKHGQFYHPCCIEARTHDGAVQFVLNVAVSDAGRQCLTREYATLEKLDQQTGCPYLPEVYGHGEVNVSETSVSSMFLGEWFHGYHEFHLSDDRDDGKRKIHIWNPENEAFFLTPPQTLQVYRLAGAILTCYYDVETTERIFPWHHAAGDFVVKIAQGAIHLRLISARGHMPLMAVEPGDASAMLEAMTAFLLETTLQMRLDRLDGVFDVVWAEDPAVEATLNGVFDGLIQKPEIEAFGDPFAAVFKKYLLSWTEDDLYALSRRIADRYPPQTPEARLLETNLRAHSAVLYLAIQNRQG